MTEKKNNTPTPKPSQGNRGERGGIGMALSEIVKKSQTENKIEIKSQAF
ncbi:hypothetical protein [Vibrio parahaemolyticus]|nr:hypothetical protein [Vibrio parahaemolyticus]